MAKKGRSAYQPTAKDKQVAYEAARLGHNEEKIAEAIGISYRTFRRNRVHFWPDIKKGRDDRDRKMVTDVEDALYRRATGFFQGERYYPPSDTAIFFLLVNRGNGRWRSINRDAETGGDYDDRLKEIASKIAKSDADTDEAI